MTSIPEKEGRLPIIEVLRTEQYYIFIRGDSTLWWDRCTAEFSAKSGSDLAEAVNPECLGTCYGIVGKVQMDGMVEPRLILIKECSKVGETGTNCVIYKIKSIVLLHLFQTESLNLTPCKKHQEPRNTKRSGLFDQKAALAKTWGVMKSATSTIKTTTQQAAAKLIAKDREKFEKRILDEVHRVFTDTDSFYFSTSYDLTNTIQRQSDLEIDKDKKNLVLWRKVDDRFFWNKHMLEDIIDLKNNFIDSWIMPIIQGFVQMETCRLELGFEAYGNEPAKPRYESINLLLISRRSRHRAGTRYKRRGVDEDGHCANYVETEQILSFHKHKVSFVQIRGSVPVFWSQPGYKYRPPPRIDRGEEETQLVFEKHFMQEQGTYGPISVVNLVEQSGKEKVIWDAYTSHMLKYNNPDITYITFDFHEYCRGMHFENVSYLIDSLVDVVKEMGYCWKDDHGVICHQKGVFRVNCIDCLDRTNVVQTAIAKSVIEIQLTKLGLLPPEGQMPQNLRSTFQLLWANNGDIISKQYAGTNALKGDYTRTGERKFTGLMKDGMNSANRYCRVHLTDCYRQGALDLIQGNVLEDIDLLNFITYEIVETAHSVKSVVLPKHAPQVFKDIALGPEYQLVNAVYHLSRYYLSRFKDAYRQTSMDMMQGKELTEDVLLNENKQQEEEDAAATAEHVKLLIEDCKKMLIPDQGDILGSWGLIDADPVTGDPTETEMDTILILTKDSYYVAEYDEQIDRITKYQRVELKDLHTIELGSCSVSVFKLKPQTFTCIRLNYIVNNEVGYFHMFRSTNLRFFNNMAVVIKTNEEILESLKAICESFCVTVQIAKIPPVSFIQGKPLEKRKSKIIPTDSTRRLGSYLDIGLSQGITRNVSETQLVALKSAGTKALTNISQQFSKINKLGQSLRRPGTQRKSTTSANQEAVTPIFTIGSSDDKSPLQKRDSLSSDDDADMECYRGSLSFSPRHKIPHLHLPNVGIVMQSDLSIKKMLSEPQIKPAIDNVSLSRVVESRQVSFKGKHPLLHTKSEASFDINKIKPKSFKKDLEVIKEPMSPDKKLQPPNSLQLNRSLSRSAGEFDDTTSSNLTKASSEIELNQSITFSKSESTLKSLKLNIASVITSPASSATKDMVLSPFSKLTKGMQSLGANLDPRKLKTNQYQAEAYRMSDSHVDEINQLILKWKDCRSKLIAL